MKDSIDSMKNKLKNLEVERKILEEKAKIQALIDKEKERINSLKPIGFYKRVFQR